MTYVSRLDSAESHQSIGVSRYRLKDVVIRPGTQLRARPANAQHNGNINACLVHAGHNLLRHGDLRPIGEIVHSSKDRILLDELITVLTDVRGKDMSMEINNHRRKYTRLALQPQREAVSSRLSGRARQDGAAAIGHKTNRPASFSQPGESTIPPQTSANHACR